MRIPWLLLILAGCKPSVSVEQTLPVANLQTYRTVALSVRATAFASQGHAMNLEAAVLRNLQHRCRFDQVARSTGAPADVLLDLNITNVMRGGGGLISNQNQARIETLLVLSDGENGDIIGTARIRGTSSGVIMNSRPPESEAIDVIAKSVADVFAKSGCSGPRIARAAEPPPPPPPDTGSGSGTGPDEPPPVDEAKRAQAETLNEDGKVKLRSADLPGALAAFQQAMSLVPDAKYQFNICLTLEAQERWADATAACRQARAMNPEPRLVSKIDRRLELLAQRK